MLHLGMSVIVALGLTALAQGYEVKTDKRIEAGAAARAASRIGDIRGTIGYDDVPHMTTLDAFVTPPVVEPETNFLPRPAWTPPKRDRAVLPPMVDDQYAPDRSISTGNVRRNVPSTWELFDADGNPVRRRGFW